MDNSALRDKSLDHSVGLETADASCPERDGVPTAACVVASRELTVREELAGLRGDVNNGGENLPDERFGHRRRGEA